MKSRELKAFNQLLAIGAPVQEWNNDTFSISAESNYDTVWADAYSDFYMNPKIVAILQANKLDYEWHDMGTAYAHRA